jgi:hypothetical protein
MDEVTRLEQPGGPVESPRRLDGVVIGVLAGFAEDGVPLVDFPGNRQDDPLVARTTAMIGIEDTGREVALLLEDADPARPVLIGLIVCPDAVEARRVSVRREGDTLRERCGCSRPRRPSRAAERCRMYGTGGTST